ncbi:MAG: oligopeptide/dipeptide transporter, ATPase subunit [Verrucomicrobiales bacterium]|nr:oligopeptide/dipeptide transporter, ATPase subunit [Verrucomicrobiales bacterium]
MNPFLQIRELKTHFPISKGIIFQREVGKVKAVDGVNLELQQGEILGLVGESGCGKSTLGRSILHIIRPTSGQVLLDGVNLTLLEPEALRSARKDFQMIFQDPYATLNPRMTVYDTLAEAFRAHFKVKGNAIKAEVVQLLGKVGLPASALNKYPHEFSGGQRQRIAIARALAVKPKLIVADEPVSALDVSVQAQIINLLAKLCRELGLTLIFISHDLSVVKHIADRVAVMYLGKIVELGPAVTVVERPLMPYTKALVSAVPIPDPVLEKSRKRMLLTGDPPSPINPPSGCPFRTRCPYAIEKCAQVVPPLEDFGTQFAACIRIREIQGLESVGSSRAG